jgi:hypothetical protein
MNRFKPFRAMSCRYGAPMGRHGSNLQLDSEHDTIDSLAASGPAYEYDSGGAYWGYSPSVGPVWAVWRRGLSSDGCVYVRGHTRDQAKRNALSL